MNVEIAYINKNKNNNKSYIKSSTLILIAFATAFFPRFLSTLLKFLTPINFLHFATVSIAFAVALFQSRSKNRKQVLASRQILVALFILLTISFASALLNQAGAINAILEFLLLAEPFMLLLAIVSIPISQASFAKLQSWSIHFVFIHLFLIYIQNYVLRLYLLAGGPDNIQGVFYRSGSGHVVGASVSCSFGAYYFMALREQPLWKRALVLALAFGNVILSDAKQVIVVFVVAFIILSISNLKDISKSLLYLIGTIIFIIIFSWAVENFEFLAAYKTWIRPEIYGPDGEANKLKFSGIRIILSHYHSNLNWLFGLGPGHTIGRLGGWMIRDYSSLLTPLGATQSTIGDEVWAYVAASWLANGSSFFAPFWGWAGIWGDLGFAGLSAYLYLASIVWRKLCVDNFSKLMMLTVFVHGLIFTQMEEPGFMLLIAILISLQYQKHILKQELFK